LTVIEPFADRIEAGRLLGEALAKKHFVDPVILALPRGGVPIALEVARKIHGPVDIVFVRKIGVPFQPELALGAIVDGDDPEIFYNDDVIAMARLTQAKVDELAEEQLKEIERRKRVYLQGRARVDIAGRTAIVVDDGLATGATARVALQSLRKREPKHLVLAVPVAPADTLAALSSIVDEIVCLAQPSPFYAIGVHYQRFGQLDDGDVISLLKEADSLATNAER